VKTPWAKKRVSTRLKSLRNVQHTLALEGFKQCVIPDFRILSVKDASHAEIAIVLEQLKLDPFSQLYLNPTPYNNQIPDFKTLSLINTSAKTAIAVYVHRYHGQNDEYDDFSEGDAVSLVMHNGWPAFVYNHATHVLSNCDIWDFQINPGSLTLPEKGHRLTSRAVGLISALVKSGNFIDPAEPSRTEVYGYSHDEPPRAKSSRWRDVYPFVWLVSLPPFLFLLSILAYPIYNAVQWLYLWWSNLL
jgi:hypothetical protein